MKLITLITLALGLVLWTGDSMAEDEAPSTSYYSYVSENGSLSFTDDQKRIPKKYAATATAGTWDELVEKTAPKISVSMPYKDVEIYIPAPVADEPVNPNWLTDCSGHITVEQIRVQQDEYNREMFVARDECGRVVSVTPSRPHLHINR